MLTTAEEMAAASALIVRVWGRPMVDAGMLVALGHAGNYIAAAYAGEDPVGVGVGFFHAPPSPVLHSHILAADPAHSGRGIGMALKLDQRAWCLERGVSQVTWTYDPLVARNAYLNLHKLGARPIEYVPDFYGTMPDQRNAGTATDRMLVRWDLGGPPGALRQEPPETYVLRRTAAGPFTDLPAAAAAQTVGVEIPHDIEGLRHDDADAAAAWRNDFRRVARFLLADGWMFTGFDRSGYYRVERRRP